MYSEEFSNLIESYVHKEDPLGPVDNAFVDELNVRKVLFESENKIYDSIVKHPSIVVGRRGSGKTTFLGSFEYSDDKEKNLIVKITTHDAIERVVNVLQKDKDGLHLFPESVAELWDWIFWTEIFSSIKSDYPNLVPTELDGKILTSIGQNSKVKKALSILGNSKVDSISILSQILSSVAEYSPKKLRDLKTKLSAIFLKNKIQCYILLDSIEDYKLSEEKMESTISGLLKATGRFNASRGKPEIRLCLPAELFHIFRDISSNSIKDFSSVLILHWHAGELLSLAAHRYRVFLNLNSNVIPHKILKSLNELEIRERDDALAFWRILLPSTIENWATENEDTIAYILRHTQLLPRQLILLLNAILRLNFRRNHPYHKINADVIRDAIRSSEGDVWREVCNAYKGVYPNAEKVIGSVVGNLPIRFNESHLHKVFNMHAKKHFTNPEENFHYFKKMLIELGCVGAVTKVTDRYIIGLFEYTEPETLQISTNTNMCLHPLFCGGERNASITSEEKLVYPYGADPMEIDRRDF